MYTHCIEELAILVSEIVRSVSLTIPVLQLFYPNQVKDLVKYYVHYPMFWMNIL